MKSSLRIKSYDAVKTGSSLSFDTKGNTEIQKFLPVVKRQARIFCMTEETRAGAAIGNCAGLSCRFRLVCAASVPALHCNRAAVIDGSRSVSRTGVFERRSSHAPETGIDTGESPTFTATRIRSLPSARS